MKRLLPFILSVGGLLASCAPTLNDPARAALPVNGLDFKVSAAMIPLRSEDRLVSFDPDVAESKALEERLRGELQIGPSTPMEVIVAPRRKDQLLPPVQDLKTRLLTAGWGMEIQAAQGANESGLVRRGGAVRRFVLLSTDQAALLASADASASAQITPGPATDLR